MGRERVVLAIRTVQDANGLARIGNAPARLQALVEQSLSSAPAGRRGSRTTNLARRGGAAQGRDPTPPWIRSRPSSAPSVAALPAPAPPSGRLLPRAPPPKSPPAQADFFRLLLAPPKHSRFGN